MTDALITSVREDMDKLALAGKTDACATKAVKAALCKACKTWNPNANLYATGVENIDDGEWLYDVTCLRNDGDGYVKRIPLVAESEWKGPRGIYHDFQKLLLARADLRVMVFDGGYFPKGDKFETLKPHIERCEVTELGDTYLLAAWSKSKDEFEYCQIDVTQKTRDKAISQNSVVSQAVRLRAA